MRERIRSALTPPKGFWRNFFRAAQPTPPSEELISAIEDSLGITGRTRFTLAEPRLLLAPERDFFPNVRSVLDEEDRELFYAVRDPLLSAARSRQLEQGGPVSHVAWPELSIMDNFLQVEVYGLRATTHADARTIAQLVLYSLDCRFTHDPTPPALKFQPSPWDVLSVEDPDRRVLFYNPGDPDQLTNEYDTPGPQCYSSSGDLILTMRRDTPGVTEF
ncbi:MAG: hypothetical protein JRN35_10805, partial [Nitrososphaerota archaeon]|nr:hypothetical protein [Nitrososphaerota archaeon]